MRTPYDVPDPGKRGPRIALTPEFAEAHARLLAEGYSEQAALRALSCAPSHASQLQHWRRRAPGFAVLCQWAHLLHALRAAPETNPALVERLERALYCPDPLERDRLQRALIAEGLESIERAE